MSCATSTNAIANAGFACSLKHLKSLHTFPDNTEQVREKSEQKSAGWQLNSNLFPHLL